MRGRWMLCPALVIILALPALSTISPDQGQNGCPQIAEDKRPALLFVEGTPDKANLWVAYQRRNELRRDLIISAKYLEVAQLGNAEFLVTASESPRIGSVYAMSVESGAIRQISATPGLRYLRAEPARKSAMLIETRMDAGEDRLVELRLDSLATADRLTLSRASLGDEYARIGHRFKISPDFEHIAYVSMKDAPRIMKPSKYELRSLNLRTLKGEVLDGDVDVEIPSISSFSHGTPPFEWISNYEVLYQHMIIPDTGGSAAEQFSLRTQGLHVFKIVDIRTGEISECFRKELRMELNGGSLDTDPLTGRLRFNREHILDYLQNQLVPRLLPYVVRSGFDGGKTEIRSASNVIYTGDSMCLETCLSASGRCFAYALRPHGTDVSDEIYAIFGANSEPLKVAHGGYALTHPVGWVE